LKLITNIALRYPIEMKRNARDRQVKLVDEAFTRVCAAVNDMEPMVREIAAQLMGKYRSVSKKFLIQSLDRRLTYQMRAGENVTVPKKLHKRNGGDIQMEGEAEVQQSIIPPGTCGAFVTALEDEFAVVRKAAIRSLGELAKLRSEDFLQPSLDHLVDMFNDELYDIRVDAIATLAPIVGKFSIREEQLEQILGVLDDKCPNVRAGVHQIIGNCMCVNSKCIEVCVKHLLRSLSRFPADKFSIYSCLRSIGLKHPTLVADLTRDMLDIHPIFAYSEKRMDDESYIGKMVLILNAASKLSSVICEILPASVKKHYWIFRYVYSSLIDPVELLEREHRFIRYLPQALINTLNSEEADMVMG